MCHYLDKIFIIQTFIEIHTKFITKHFIRLDRAEVKKWSLKADRWYKSH